MALSRRQLREQIVQCLEAGEFPALEKLAGQDERVAAILMQFFYDPGDADETVMIAGLYMAAAQALIAEGALFTRPYGALAPLIYERAASYRAALQRMKKVFDPKNVMNPGNLCF